jgi:hypothetical protein
VRIAILLASRRSCIFRRRRESADDVVGGALGVRVLLAALDGFRREDDAPGKLVRSAPDLWPSIAEEGEEGIEELSGVWLLEPL